MMKSVHLVALCMIIVVWGCSAQAVPQINDNDAPPTNTNENTSPNENVQDNLNENSQPPENDRIGVSLIALDEAQPDQDIEVQAKIEEPQDDPEEYYFLWTLELLGGSGDTSQTLPMYHAASANDYIEGLDLIRFIPKEVFGGGVAGKQIRTKVEVVSFLTGGSPRSGFAEKRITIVPGEPLANENGNANENINENLNENGNANENGNENVNENDNANLNENSSGGIGGGGGGGGGSGGEGELEEEEEEEEAPPDPCEGITALTVLIDSPATVSTFEGSLRLSPTVCGGTAPYSYSWTPVNLLTEPNAFGSGVSEITSPEADFIADQPGNFNVTVAVTDDIGAVVQGVYDITVNGYSPLVAVAGDDQAVTEGDALTITGSALGGSGSFTYAWSPGGATTAAFDPDTNTAGDTTYTLTVTDTETGHTDQDEVRVVVFAAKSDCTDADYALSSPSASVVAYYHDPGGSASDLALIVGQSTMYFYDLDNELLLGTTLNMPANVTGIAVNADRHEAYLSTKLSGSLTKSVLVIENLNGTPSLGTNISLGSEVISVGGLAVVPSTGKVLAAVHASSPGVYQIDPDAGTVDAAVQNIHHSDSFAQPIDIAVIDQGGLSVAVVANATGAYVTLVPLDTIVFTPNDAGGGGLASLNKVSLDQTARAVIADPDSSRMIIGSNHVDGRGRVYILNITDKSTASLGSSIYLPSKLIDRGLAIDSSEQMIYAAIGNSGLSLIDLSFGMAYETIQTQLTSVYAVTVDTEYHQALAVGKGPYLSAVCP